MMAKQSAGGRRMSGDELGNVVLSWSLDDILNDHLFTDKVNPIPRTFQSLEGYLDSYIFPLLEETRSDLSSCLEDISCAPWYKIQSIQETKMSELYRIDLDMSSNESSANDGYKARKGYFTLHFLSDMSNINPETVNDFWRYGVTFCLVLVFEIMMDDDPKKVFMFKTSKHIDTKKDILHYQNAIFITNISTNARIWRMLHCNSGINSNFNIIQAILHPIGLADVSCNICYSLKRDCWSAKVPEEIILMDLNASQIKAVKSAVSTLSCKHSHFVQLIWGPPGTGKTKTVCAILWAFLHMKCRILTCAPTNVAVVGACSRLISLMKTMQENNDGLDLPFSLGDIVLFGNIDQMKVNEELRVVFLEHRVKQLLDCFSPVSGLKQRITSMISFLKDCEILYERYLETRSNKNDNILFPGFMKNEFKVVSSSLEYCLNIFCLHFPRRSLLKTDAKIMCDAIRLLGCLHSLIIKATDGEMLDTFLHGSRNAESIVVQDEIGASTLGMFSRIQLEETKSDLLNCLEVLKHSINIPCGVDENWVKKFCLRSASIIFCTASSSFLLHSIEMDSLDVVVVDEASQLKEAEILIPLCLNGMKHAILVGDENQLRSMVKSQVCKSAGYGLSLFERLVSLGHPKHLLNIQYRMHPSISLFPNINFYRKQIFDGPNVQHINYGKFYCNLLFGSYAFINISDGREELDDGGSWRNMIEVAVVLHLIKNIFKSWKANGGQLSIGVIAPYVSQVKAIKEKLGNTYDVHNAFDIRVNSIDGFQGEEDDIIILSTVRCNRGGSIGFLSDIQRMNVALTRSRYCLWILGNADTLLSGGTTWEKLVLDAKYRQCFFNANDKKGLSKLLLNAKCELDELDDMLHPNSVLNTGVWKVFFSTDFRKSFVNLKSFQTKKEVIQTMVKLATGWRSKKTNVGIYDSFELAQVYRVREHFLVWTVDIIKNERYMQVIKVWDILSISQLTRLTPRLNHIFSMYTETYVNRCKAKCTNWNIEVPVTWNTYPDVVQYKNYIEQEQNEHVNLCPIDDNSVLENSKVNESLLLMKFYALSSGIASHLLTANDGTELNIPFELTNEEMHVVLFSKSSFILGRSGTGKTTILTTKLVQKQQQQSLALKGFCLSEGDHSLENNLQLKEKNFLRQVFITVSPKLCLAIKDHIVRLTSFAASGNLYGSPSAIEMHDTSCHYSHFVDMPDNFHDLPNKHYPLIITFDKFLMMLDGSMGCSFFGKFWKAKDFLSNESNASKSLALQMLFQKQVNYEKFVSSYWPHFNTQLTKELDASIVYTEIISHIKGNFKVCSFLDGKMERAGYIKLSKKRSSLFCEEIRNTIYDIFLDYEKAKLSKGEFDISDFVIDLHRRLSHDAFQGDKFDFVYVDEVQDLTMSQIALLKYVCTNFEEGFIFAGDTAQTIARGVNFRFEDVRSLFYNEFVPELRTEGQTLKKEIVHIKNNFQLKQNFRTHSGVLKLSNSILDILYCFFPLSIDRLAPETSSIFGESPVLLESSMDSNAMITIFGSNTGESNNMIEFGAEQVILVRDDCTKRQVVDLVGNKALILTIIECKGLEFQDVLLYNFFGGSPLTNKWRVVYDYMSKHGLDYSGMMSFPNFDHGKHNLLCSELKQLYVAITRTRQRLWIGENSSDYCKPVFDYWKSLCLVQVRHLDSSFAQAMRAVSTVDDWKLRGIKLFNEGNFEMATMCFERAGDPFREKWARAAGLVCTGDRVVSSNPDMAKDFFRKAADMYESIGKPENAAACYIKFKDFKHAGMIYLEKCGESCLEAAGDCFSMESQWSLAADVYAKAKCFSKCLSTCSKGELFDVGLQFIKKWKVDSSFNNLDKIEKPFLEDYVMHYLNVQDIAHLVELARVLQSMDLIRNFLKPEKYLDELLEFEKRMGNYLEAADLAHVKGNILLEAEMLEKAGQFEKSAGLYLLHVIVKSHWNPGSKGWPLKKFAMKEEILHKAQVIAKKVSESFYNLVSSEVYILSNMSKDLINLSEHLMMARRYQNIRLEIFTLREIIDIHLQVEPCKYLWEPGLVLDVEKHYGLLMCQNIASVESLMLTWRLWKDKIHKVLSHLCLTPNSKGDKFGQYEQFSFDYLGVLWNPNQNSFVLLNPEAAWINISATTSREGENRCMDSKQYIESSERYWRLEMHSLGLAILEKLESFILFSKCCEKTCNTSEKTLLFPFSKARIILSIFEVLKFFRELDTISFEGMAIIKRISTSSHDYFFNILFPVKWIEGSNMSMLNFHKCLTAKEIIEETVLTGLDSLNDTLAFSQIGKVLMLLFLTGDLKDKLYNKSITQLSHKPPWKVLIILLRRFLIRTYQDISLILELEQALRDVLSTGCRESYDFISLHCFTYLIDCLLFCASSCLGSSNSFFSTKATLLEMLRCDGFKVYMDECLISQYDMKAFESVQRCLNGIIDLVSMLLLRINEMKEWIVKSSMSHFDYSNLITKMLIILCLANLNSNKTFCAREFLGCIMDDLQGKFREAIALCEEISRNLNHFSNALEMDQNSLVYISTGNRKFELWEGNAIVLHPQELRCREDVIKKMFPKMSMIEQKKESKQEFVGNPSSENVLSMCKMNVSDYRIQSGLQEEQLGHAIISDEDLRQTGLQFCLDLNASLRRNDEIKLDDMMHCLDTLVAWISQGSLQTYDALDISHILKIVINIKFHSCLIDGGVEPLCTTIEELEQRCPGWKSNIISFIDSMLKDLEQSSESIPEVNENSFIESCDVNGSSIAKDISNPVLEVTHPSEGIASSFEGGCEETSDICVDSEVEKSSDAPRCQYKSKGSNKKTKEKGKGKGKGKGKAKGKGKGKGKKR